MSGDISQVFVQMQFLLWQYLDVSTRRKLETGLTSYRPSSSLDPSLTAILYANRVTNRNCSYDQTNSRAIGYTHIIKKQATTFINTSLDEPVVISND
jgi:hypothetical protein